MKKIVSLVLVLALALSLSIPAFAADNTLNSTTQSGNTTATYTMAKSYTVTIPDAITVGGSAITVKAENVVIDPKDTLEVKVSSANGWNLTYQGDRLAYHLAKDSTEVKTDNALVLSVAAGTATGSQALTAALNSDVTVTKSGTYTDTLTFTVSISTAS